MDNLTLPSHYSKYGCTTCFIDSKQNMSNGVLPTILCVGNKGKDQAEVLPPLGCNMGCERESAPQEVAWGEADPWPYPYP